MYHSASYTQGDCSCTESTVNQIMPIIKQAYSTKRKTLSGVGNKHALLLSVLLLLFTCSLSLWLCLYLSLSLSYATCIIAFLLHWPWGKWSPHNVTVVILIDGVDTCAVPEHRASLHTDMTNFREQIIMARIMINPLSGNGNIVNTYELMEDIQRYNRNIFRGCFCIHCLAVESQDKDDEEEIHS